MNHHALLRFILPALAAAAIGTASLPAVADTPLAPADLIAHAADQDGQTVSVAGPVSNFQQKSTPKGTVSLFRLCNDQCVTVVDFGATKHANGDKVTVSGVFHANFKTRQGTIKNAVEVGG